MHRLIRLILWAVPAVRLASQGSAAELGVFEGDSDVGMTRRAGSTRYDPVNHSYTVSGSGENMWSTNDAFHFVWKKVSGDILLTADVAFIGKGGNPHRKACLMLRQNLDANSAYVDAAVHGDGLTSLQYREAKGSLTREVKCNVAAPRRLGIEKRGPTISLLVAREGEALEPAGASIRVPLEEPYYIGLAVCAHDSDALEKVVFSNVALTAVKDAKRPP